MQSSVSVRITQDMLSTLDSIINPNYRSKAINQYILSHLEIENVRDNEYPTNEKGINLPISLSTAALNKIDTYVNKKNRLTRSTVLRYVIQQVIQDDHLDLSPVINDKKMTTVQVKKGTRDLFLKYIDKMERSKKIEEYIITGFSMPSINALKQKVTGEKETIPLYLSESTYQKIDEYVSSYNNNVTRTQILRYCIHETLSHLESFDKRNEEQILKDVIEQLLIKYSKEEVLDLVKGILN